MEERNLPQKRIVFIINPVSGTHGHKHLDRIIEELVDKENYRYKIHFTERTGHAEELAREALENGADIIVAVGGDGTVNEVGRVLAGTRAAFGIIPTGSGNGLARHLKVPMGVRRAMKVINRGKTAPIDTATLNGKPFISIAGLGFDAFVAKKFATAERRGFFSYFRITFREYFTYKPKKYVMNVDGTEMTRRALLVSFANSSQFGNNASIAPTAELDDGFIDVCIVKKIPFRKLYVIPPILYVSWFNRSRYVEVIRAKEIFVRRKRGKTVHLDGDPYKMGKDIHVKINPLSLNIIIP